MQKFVDAVRAATESTRDGQTYGYNQHRHLVLPANHTQHLATWSNEYAGYQFDLVIPDDAANPTRNKYIMSAHKYLKLGNDSTSNPGAGYTSRLAWAGPTALNNADTDATVIAATFHGKVEYDTRLLYRAWDMHTNPNVFTGSWAQGTNGSSYKSGQIAHINAMPKMPLIVTEIGLPRSYDCRFGKLEGYPEATYGANFTTDFINFWSWIFWRLGTLGFSAALFDNCAFAYGTNGSTWGDGYMGQIHRVGGPRMGSSNDTVEAISGSVAAIQHNQYEWDAAYKLMGWSWYIEKHMERGHKYLKKYLESSPAAPDSGAYPINGNNSTDTTCSRPLMLPAPTAGGVQYPDYSAARNIARSIVSGQNGTTPDRYNLAGLVLPDNIPA
jgi:hypothetical protein